MTQRSAALSVSAFILILTGCSREPASATAAAPPARAVRVIAASAEDVPLEIAAIGTVEAISSVEVKSRITAPVVRVAFTEGQDVRQGDVLFELDPEQLNRQIAEMEANVARDVANEKQAEANIARDQAALRNAQSTAKRFAQLLKEGISPREQSEQADATADSASAAVDADRAAVDSARAALNADRARLNQTRLQLDYTKVRAPIAGRAGSIPIKQGSLARENDTTLVTILQTNPVYVSFAVPEDRLSQVRQHNAQKPLQVTATTPDGNSGTGVLRFIDNSVDPTSGTIRLKASFDNSRRLLWPGQFVNVRALVNVERERILISSQTVQTGPQGKYVWVFNPADSTVAMRNIAVLRIYTPPGRGEQAVVGSGLRAGERVISEGQSHLAPGARVRVLKAI